MTATNETTAKTMKPPTEIPVTTGILLNQFDLGEENGISSVYGLVDRLVAEIAIVVEVVSAEAERQ